MSPMELAVEICVRVIRKLYSVGTQCGVHHHPCVFLWICQSIIRVSGLLCCCSVLLHSVCRHTETPPLLLHLQPPPPASTWIWVSSSLNSVRCSEPKVPLQISSVYKQLYINTFK